MDVALNGLIPTTAPLPMSDMFKNTAFIDVDAKVFISLVPRLLLSRTTSSAGQIHQSLDIHFIQFLW